MVTVKFNEVDEFLEEIEKDHRDIERGVVRVTNMFRTSRISLTTRNTLVVSTYVLRHQLVRLEVYCGDLWGVNAEDDQKVMARAEEVQDRIAAKCKEVGLELRSGILEDKA